MTKVQIWGFKFERCDHEWVPRDRAQPPVVCPKCKSPYWDRPRQNTAVVAASLSQPKKAVVPPPSRDVIAVR